MVKIWSILLNCEIFKQKNTIYYYKKSRLIYHIITACTYIWECCKSKLPIIIDKKIDIELVELEPQTQQQHTNRYIHDEYEI